METDRLQLEVASLRKASAAETAALKAELEVIGRCRPPPARGPPP